MFDVPVRNRTRYKRLQNTRPKYHHSNYVAQSKNRPAIWSVMWGRGFVNCILIGNCPGSSTKYHKHRSGTRVYQEAITSIEVGLLFTKKLSHTSKWDSFLPPCRYTHQKMWLVSEISWHALSNIIHISFPCPNKNNNYTYCKPTNTKLSQLPKFSLRLK